MTYNVFGGMLNLAQSINFRIHSLKFKEEKVNFNDTQFVYYYTLKYSVHTV